MSHYSDTSTHFSELMETLLAGTAICEYRAPALHRLLHDQERVDRERAEEMLEALGRRLECTNDIFYAVYVGDDDTVRRGVDELFARYLKNARLIGEFFDLLRIAQRGGEGFQPGNRFTFADALTRITSTQNTVDRLFEIASMVTQSKDPSPDQALRRLIEKLTKEGYLYQISSSAQLYVVTGEMELFNQWATFVAEAEGIDLDTETDAAVETQRELWT